MAGKNSGLSKERLAENRAQSDQGFSGVYAIEFTSAEAAADYPRVRCMKRGQKLARAAENSLSFQVSTLEHFATSPSKTGQTRSYLHKWFCGPKTTTSQYR